MSNRFFKVEWNDELQTYKCKGSNLFPVSTLTQHVVGKLAEGKRSQNEALGKRRQRRQPGQFVVAQWLLKSGGTSIL
jgi:hypothetical protein